MADPFLMKGKVYGEHKHKLVYPVAAEVKYDEIRLHVKRFPAVAAPGLANHIIEHVEFLSYAGKPLFNLWHWADNFLGFMKDNDLDDLDIGVEVNENFNDSYRWCRSSSGIPGEKVDTKTGHVAPALDVGMVAFYLFDIPGSRLPFGERLLYLDDLAEQMEHHYSLNAYRPALQVCKSEAELDALFIEVRELGLEGLMVKTFDHTYEIGKRIDGWLKMKPESEADGVITAVNEAVSLEGVPLGRAGSVDVTLEDGSTASPAGIDHALGKLMFDRPEFYIGQHCMFKYMERDRKGGYRHPSFVRLREPK